MGFTPRTPRNFVFFLYNFHVFLYYNKKGYNATRKYRTIDDQATILLQCGIFEGFICRYQ